MKTYKVEIIYTESRETLSMKVKVDGKQSPLPGKLRLWIAKDCIDELFLKEKS